MDVTDRSRERVDGVLDRLRDRHGVAPVVDDRWTVAPETWDRDRRRHEAGTVGGAGAWVRDADGRVLLVRERSARPWSEPSGKQEPGERLAQTARREVREETGVTVALDGVELAQRVAETDGDRPPLWRLVVVFGARYVGGEPRPRPDEIAAVRWVAERPGNLAYDAFAALPVG